MRGAGITGPAAPTGRLWRLALATIAGGGAISAYLTLTALQGTPPLCLAGACAEVAASPYARFLGVPTAGWGLALYLAAGGVAALGVRHPERGPALAVALFGLAAFGATFSLYLLWLQAVVLRAVCSWCVVSDALWLVLVGLAVALVRRAGLASVAGSG